MLRSEVIAKGKRIVKRGTFAVWEYRSCYYATFKPFSKYGGDIAYLWGTVGVNNPNKF